MVLRGSVLDFSDEATRIQPDARPPGPACAPAELLPADSPPQKNKIPGNLALKS